jgi:hypothetical protein
MTTIGESKKIFNSKTSNNFQPTSSLVTKYYNSKCASYNNENKTMKLDDY